MVIFKNYGGGWQASWLAGMAGWQAGWHGWQVGGSGCFWVCLVFGFTIFLQGFLGRSGAVEKETKHKCSGKFK